MTDYDDDKVIHDPSNPEQMQKLLSSTPIEFMSMFGQDVREANRLISTHAMLLKQRSTEFQEIFESGELTEDYCLDIIIKTANQIDRAFDVLRAYAQAYKG